MILTHVTYELFEHEFDQFLAEEANGWHQLDGQVRLDFSDSPSVYISWIGAPVQYCIGLGSQSHFKSDAMRHHIDMTKHPYWSNLIFKDISISFIAPLNQVIRIYSYQHQVFLSSQYDDGMFQGDCVRISQIQPSYQAV